MASPKGVAIVTGCAAGIGRAIVFRLASDGYDLALNDLPAKLSDLEHIQAEIKLKERRSIIVAGDVSSEEFVTKMVDDVVRELGSLEVMVANAAISPWRSVLDIRAADFDHVLAVNARSVFLCFQQAARVMISQGRGGRIIGASSNAGKQGTTWSASHYTASKWAIRGLTQSFASEIGHHNITVNTYAPGAIDTGLLESGGQEFNERSGIPGMDLKAIAAHASVLKRIGQPEEVAAWVSFIASPDSSYITGQTQCINGGLYFD